MTHSKVDECTLLTQLFNIHAKIEVLLDQFIKTDEQKREYYDSLEKHFKAVLNEFDSRFGCVIEQEPYRVR